MDVQFRVKARVNADDLLSEVIVGGAEGKAENHSKFELRKHIELNLTYKLQQHNFRVATIN